MEEKSLINSIQDKFPNEEWIIEICRIFDNRTLKQFKTNIYPSELNHFLERHEDNDELLFIDLQLDSIEADIEYIEKRDPLVNSDDFQVYCDISDLKEDFVRSLKKIKMFLEYQKQKLEMELKIETTSLELAPEIKQKTNKSLLFNGKELNLSERFKIANKVLDIDNKLRTLNIKDLEKYQLLAYILGCDKDNARNLMNGSYKSKDRELKSYFNYLKLNE